MTMFLAACLFGHAPSRAQETFASRRVTSADDLKAILQIVEKFKDAIKTKNPKNYPPWFSMTIFSLR
jgi:hypothetical protein